MKDELFVLRDLSRLDSASDADQATVAAMVKAVQSSTAEVAAARVHLGERQAALDAAREAERALNRRLQDYTQRRDDTRALIDTGRAPDFAIAQRQWEQLARITDDLETQTLEAIDAREAAEAALAAAEARLSAGRDADTAARTRYHATSPGLKAQVAERTTQRAPLLARVSADQRRQYEDLRQRGMAPLTFIVGGTCELCHRSVPPQILNEVQNSLRIHNCRGCGRFFFDVRQDDGSTEAGEDD